MKKRLLALALTLAMVLSVMPVTALAEGDLTAVAQIDNTEYTSLDEALTKVQNGETIKILAAARVDRTETYEITGKSITLDLNGQTVTWNASAKNMIEIGTDGGLTIQDATDAGVLHFTGTGTTSYGSGITTSDNGSLSLTGGTVLYEHSKTGYGLNITGSSTFTMTGGAVKIAGKADYAVRLASTGLCQLNGGKILFDEGATASKLYGVYAVLYSTAGEAAGFNLGNLTVDGSMIPETKTVVCVYGYNDGTPVTISGGTYTANDKSTSYAVGGGSSNNTAISGGTFDGAVKAAIGKVTGGQFSVQPSAAYLPEGKIYEMRDDGCYHVVDGTYVARLGTVGYTNWDALWKDASEGATASAVYILADVDEITVPEGKNVTFYNSGNCTIGKITNNGTCKIIFYAMTGTEVVNNGSLNLGHEVKSLVNNQDATTVATSYTYAKVTDSITNSGTMTISKGTYPCTITNTGTITLTGGSFAQEVTAWCAEGYTTQKSDGLWVVVKDGPHAAEIDGYWYTSLSAALSAAQDGDTVKLLMDTTLGTKENINNKRITLDLNQKKITYTATGTSANTAGAIIVKGTSNVTITGDGSIDFDDSYLADNAGSTGRMIEVEGSAVLTIDSGTFHAGLVCVLADENAQVIIKGGTYSAYMGYDGRMWLLNLQDSQNAKFYVFGGTFENYDPSNSATENPEDNFCADGYITTSEVKNEKTYYTVVPNPGATFAAETGGVKYTSLTDAIVAAKSGDTVTLLSKYEGEPVAIAKAITIDLAATETDSAKFTAGEHYQKTSDGTKLTFALKTFTVTFNTNGGSAVASQTVMYNTAAAKPTDPTRSGYTFEGWYTDKALTTAYDFSTPVTVDLELYAKWAAVSTGGGSSSTGNKTETVTNPDGSTTTTVIKPDGSATATTKAPDGSSSVVNTTKDGQVSATVTVSSTAVSNAEDAVPLPMPELSVTTDREEAPVVTVNLPAGTTAKVEIPVEDVTAGTVAILIHTDGTEEIVMDSVVTEDGVTFTVENGAKVKIVDNSIDFTDVKDGYWGEDEIDFVTSHELFTGTSADKFSPENTMTRAMIVTVLARYEGVDTTAGDEWYEVGADWAVENGVSDGSNLMEAITREQLVTMLYRYAGEPEVNGTVTGFPDAASVSDWAANAMAWAIENGLINGMTDGTLKPQGTATRAQVAAILARFCEKMAK